MTKYLRVKNWEDFQHYKDRNPPWIKLHRDLLRDYEFQCLQDASKLHLMLIWLLASQMDNKIPADENFIKNQLGIKGKVDLKELIDKGYLIDDSGVLAERKQVAIPETETETETETEGFNQFWEIYPRKHDKKKARDKFIGLIKKGIDYEKIITGATKYKQHCEANNTLREYIKHPTTWLNGECWENEYTFAKQKEKPYRECGMSQMQEYLGWN